MKNTAFTLIELVIVIVLLGILAAIALPRFVNFSEDAKSSGMKAYVGAFKNGITNANMLWRTNSQPSTITYRGQSPDLHYHSNGYIDGTSDGSSTADAGWSHSECQNLLTRIIEEEESSITTPDDAGVTNCYNNYTASKKWCVEKFNEYCQYYNLEYVQSPDERSIIYCFGTGGYASCTPGQVRTLEKLSGVTTWDGYF